MPTVGLEYRYPFINVQSWGTQTIEPIAQVILRPNETGIGKLPNEDSQSLMFDASNLFRVNKFSGWDRVEGGGRANVGVQYTAQFNRGGYFNAVFGQSYQLFGQNSFAVGGPDQYRPRQRPRHQPVRLRGADDVPAELDLYLHSRFRFDHDTFALQRIELEGRANFDRWTRDAAVRQLCRAARARLPDRREGMLRQRARSSSRPTGRLFGGARYDLAGRTSSTSTQIGVGYVDDCLILAVNYITEYTYQLDVDGLQPRGHAAAQPAHARRQHGVRRSVRPASAFRAYQLEPDASAFGARPLSGRAVAARSIRSTMAVSATFA